MSSRFIMPFADVGSGIKPSSGAKLFFFKVDGVTPKDTFSDQLSTPTANTNPVIADSNGVFGDIFIIGAYKVTLQDKNGSQIFGLAKVDEYITASGSVAAEEPTVIAMAANTSKSYVVGDVINTVEFASGTGGGATYDVVLTSSVTPNTFTIIIGSADALISFVLRFNGSINAQTAGALGDDANPDLGAVQEAIDTLPSGGVLLLQPGKTYSLSEMVTITKPLTIIAKGAIIKWKTAVSVGANKELIKVTSSNVHIKGGTWQHIDPSVTVRDGAQFAISFEGTLATPLDNVTITHAKVNDILGYAVVFLFCKNFRCDFNQISNIGWGGVLTLSAFDGTINNNFIDNINPGTAGTPAVPGDNAWGIAMTKNNGTQAARPLSHDIDCSHNHVSNVRTWEGIDTHGGANVTIDANTVKNCRTGIAAVSYVGGPVAADDNFGPQNVSITGNIVQNDLSIIPHSDAQRGIIIEGNSGGGTDGKAITLTGGSVTNCGGTVTGDEIGAIECQAIDGLTIGGGLYVEGAGSSSIYIFSCTAMNINGVSLKNISPTLDAIYPSATLTYSGNPADGDTIVLNGITFTYRASPSGNFEIQIGGSQADTIANTQTQFATARNQTSPPIDGRLELLAMANDSVSIITVTLRWPTRAMASFITLTESSSVIVASSGTLSVPSSDTGGFVVIDNLAGGVSCEGAVSNVTIKNTGTAQIGIKTKVDAPNLHFSDNQLIGSGILYDLVGSATLSVGGVDSLFPVKKVMDIPNITAGSSFSVNLPLPAGAVSGVYLDYSMDRTLDGLVTSHQPSAAGYTAFQFFNPTSGAINIASFTMYYKYGLITQVGAGDSV